jgi:hypothetical protein
VTLSFPPILAQQQLKSEQQFFAQHGHLLVDLSEDQLNTLKKSNFLE